MAVLNSHKKSLSREENLLKGKSKTFCLDCVIDWCKLRNEVTYCSQKYKGTSCYNCNDDKCTVKRVAGS
ncbi:MAG: hypothetical protein HZR80_06855 [Candidatus Heimdallarchaeota archaeon]